MWHAGSTGAESGGVGVRRSVRSLTVLSDAAQAALDELIGRDDPSIVGLVLSGSAARGMATSRSDVDVYVVRDEEDDDRQTLHSEAIDEIPRGLTELEEVAPFGSGGWWFRWAFAYAHVLRDDTGGRIERAVRRQAVLDDEEQRSILVDHDQLDGWVNFAYRSLKCDRDGRPLQARLDAAESLPWLLHVVFTLAGRVRPYNKYLPWELREHPLDVPEWSAEAFLPEIERTLDGDAAAIRRTFAVVDREVRAWDAAHGTTVCGDLVESWGDELQTFRDVNGSSA
jgi:predicted nucleotidyltransferase